MTEWFRNLRYKLAYAIASDAIDDLQDRFSALLDYTTGGLLSKTNYTIGAMQSAVDDYVQRTYEEWRKEEDE